MIVTPILQKWELRMKKVDLILRTFDAKSCDPSLHPKSLVLVHENLLGSSLLSSLISDLAPSLSPWCSIPRSVPWLDANNILSCWIL